MVQLFEKINSLINDNNLILIGVIASILLLSVIIGKIISSVIRFIAKRKKVKENNVTAAFLIAVAKSVFLFVLYGLWVAILFRFSINSETEEILHTITRVLFALAVANLLYRFVDVIGAGYEGIVMNTESKTGKLILPALRKTLRIVVVVFFLFHIAQILSDKPITSIIAGLGIGGLAVALAAQDTIKHFIGSFVIVGDKPFTVGERVVIDGHDGTIEAIGLRSTKIRTLNGHLVSIPNGELANRTIQNIGKREYIKHEGNISITYETPVEKIEKAICIVKELLENHEGINEEFPPRVFFNKLMSDSLNIMYLYWYHPPQYWDYMAFNEKLNIEIIKRFNQEGIEFAYPTQKLFMQKIEN